MLLLLACTSTSLTLGDPPRPKPDGADPDGTGPDTTEQLPDHDSEAPDTGEVPKDTGEEPEEEEPDDSLIFNLDALHTIEISLSNDAWNHLSSDPYTYVMADVTVDGQAFPQVGVRIKGRLGSLRYLPAKSGFKIDFLEYGATEKLQGLEKINLNNMVQDCAKVHELASYGIHRMVGLPAPRVAYTQVLINGEDYGLYSLVEDYDDEFLQKNFADPSGNLYDGDYYLWPNGNYALVDFTTSGQDYFTLDEGTDVGLADIHAVTEAISHAGDDFEGVVGALVDLEQHADFFAVAAWTGHYDSYSYYSNNYRVYFDPGRGGKAVFMPWDPDWAFYAATQVRAPYGTISSGCFSNPTCRDNARAMIARLSSEVPGSPLQAEVEAAINLIEPALREDPKLETSLNDIHACQADLLDWFSRRGQELSSF